MKVKLRYKIIILLAVVAVMAAGLIGITNYIVIKTAAPRILDSVSEIGEEYDCIIVLGAGVFGDNTPSAILEDRLITGIELYKYGAADKIIMSGDHGRKEYDEVNIMKNYALDEGIPSDDVFMDHAGFSTYETMYRARDVFEAKRVLIVTQKFHMARALYIANSLGLEADGVICDRRRYMYETRNNIREVVARTKDCFYVWLDVLPKFLGETIPVSGNGDLTND